MSKVTLQSIQNNKNFQALINSANESLSVIGYTEHGLRHVGYVSKTTGNILRMLGYDERTVELGEIAGWIHDIGNCVNRHHHGVTGATIAYPILLGMGMPAEEIATIISAIGNHEEQTGTPVNPVSAALIIADKSDAHRTRVRKGAYDPKDIHDRVNFSIMKNFVIVDPSKHRIKLVIYMNDSSSPMEYFQIYMSRMLLSEKAANLLGCVFELMINNMIINNHGSAVAHLRLSSTEKNVSEENAGPDDLQQKTLFDKALSVKSSVKDLHK